MFDGQEIGNDSQGIKQRIVAVTQEKIASQTHVETINGEGFSAEKPFDLCDIITHEKQMLLEAIGI